MGSRPASVALAALAALALPGSARPEAPVLHAKVVAEAAVSLVDVSGAQVRQLAPGSYTVVVDDSAHLDNFHLSGPGVALDSGIHFTGTRTWSVEFREGVFTFVSDPRADSMRGSFTVGSPPEPSLRARVTDSAIALEHAGGGAVSELAPGTYVIAVDDASAIESFRLVGPGVSEHTQRHTAYATVWTVTLAEGTYHYFSDRRRGSVRGSFRVGAGGPSDPGMTLAAEAGPDFAISLVGADFAPVTRLDRGTYTIVVDDRSPDHNFHLTGPGVDRETTLEGVGKTTWTVRVAGGHYAFFCDPHTRTMLGEFDVPHPPAIRLSARVSAAGRATLLTTDGKPVRTLRSGPATIVVSDRSRAVGFRLVGPRTTRHTSAAFVGTVRWALQLRPGTYHFGAGSLSTRFRVTER